MQCNYIEDKRKEIGYEELKILPFQNYKQENKHYSLVGPKLGLCCGLQITRDNSCVKYNIIMSAFCLLPKHCLV